MTRGRSIVLSDRGTLGGPARRPAAPDAPRVNPRQTTVSRRLGLSTRIGLDLRLRETAPPHHGDDVGEDVTVA